MDILGLEHGAEVVLPKNQRIYFLRHIESGEFICLLQEGVDYLACFSDGDTAYEFRQAIGLIEYLNVVAATVARSPFAHLWLDGESIAI